MRSRRMPERTELLLKGLCLALAALMFCQFARVVFRSNPLKRLSIPALPALPAEPDAHTDGKGTNTIPNPMPAKAETNAVSGRRSGTQDTNSVTDQGSAKSGTNSPSLREA